MKQTIVHIVVVVWLALTHLYNPSRAFAQPAHVEQQIQDLATKILNRVPDIPRAERGLGRGEERMSYALKHAKAIVAASHAFAEKWDSFGLEHFDAKEDLPYLVAALTYRESAFQPVVRRRDGEVLRMETSGTVPASIARGNHLIARGDFGFMQVRVPSTYGDTCNVDEQTAVRLLTNHMYSYNVGVCILTETVETAFRRYRAEPAARKMGWGQRPNYIFSFFREHPELRELVAIERYNWGNSDYYINSPASGFSYRVLQEYLYFREEQEDIL